MDSAENQKAEIERIKQAVNQNFRSRRAFRVSKKPTTASRPAPLATERWQDVMSTSHPNPLTSSLEDIMPHIGKLELEDSEGGTAVFFDTDPLRDFSHAFGEMPAQNILLADANKTAPYGSTQEVGQKFYPFSFHPDAPLAENEHELSLILHYLDKIFPLQYYFYQPATLERGRGWLLSLFLRSKSSYFTALAFSSLTLLMFVHKGDVVAEERLSLDLDRYHCWALSELQAQLDLLPTISGYEHLKLGVEILSCMMQLMSIEVFRETKDYDRWKDDWEVHLQAAGTLLSVIGTDLGISSASSPTSTSSGEDDSKLAAETGNAPALLPLNEIAGLDFFMTTYMWGDICCCASIGTTSADRGSFSYLTYLEEDRVRLDHIMGCRNWAMVAIKKISDLETWKKEMQSSRSLSIPTLSRKAAELEAGLHDGLESLTKDHETLNTYEQECNLVTELYALSALTYLAVVVSGNSHLLAEVRSSVARTLKALKALPPRLLIRVSWAYCVAGCMVDESDKEHFRRLLLDAHAAGHMLGTLWNGLEIMEEFWRLREDVEFMQSANKCAWALAMDSLGAKILLI